MRRFAILFAAAVSLSLSACAESVAPGETPSAVAFRTTPLTIETSGGAHEFTVEVAETPEQRERGLMYRETMAANAGMIFDYQRDVQVSMWMANTVLPLDMLFISADGTVAEIAEGAVPFSHAIIASRGKVRSVLELNAGVVAQLSLKPGDKVRHEIFGNAP